MNLTDIRRDKVFEQCRQHHLLTVGFLTALKENFNHEEAFRLACAGFANFMIKNYELVLGSTKPGSQERFDKFRDHYAECAAQRDYLNIIESSPTVLRVRYERCPFFELMSEHDLGDLAYAYCLSDSAFTKTVLPEVEFSRAHIIVKGDRYCDHTWVFKKKASRTHRRIFS